MKMPVVLFCLYLLTVSAEYCSLPKKPPVYKARLEINGICRNYTFQLLEGELDSTRIESSWKDETTGKVYSNVFGVSNPCSIPENIKQGDHIYFVIDTAAAEDCIVCEAYYPTPAKKLQVKIVKP